MIGKWQRTERHECECNYVVAYVKDFIDKIVCFVPQQCEVRYKSWVGKIPV